MRFARGDMWGYIVSHKNHHGASHRLYGVLQRRSRQKIDFCEILDSGRFSTFATKSAPNGHAGAVVSCQLSGNERTSLAKSQNERLTENSLQRPEV